MRATKTPQQKKLLSYAKDCRNIYGESSKASRKGIRLHKQHVNQSYRVSVKTILKDLGLIHSRHTELEQDRINRIESQVKSHRRINWKKSPDIPLNEYVAIKQSRRLTRTNRRKPKPAED